jgi:hypothetical protein
VHYLISPKLYAPRNGSNVNTSGMANFQVYKNNTKFGTAGDTLGRYAVALDSVTNDMLDSWSHPLQFYAGDQIGFSVQAKTFKDWHWNIVAVMLKGRDGEINPNSYYRSFEWENTDRFRPYLWPTLLE